MDLVLQVGSVVVIDDCQENGHEHVQADHDEDDKEYAQPGKKKVFKTGIV